MDWFERLTGFPETDYAATKARFRVEGSRLISPGNGRGHQIGDFEFPSLGELRSRAPRDRQSGRLRVQLVSGDVRRMHAAPEHERALFQVASQFNLLEMVNPEVSPEHGVAGYEHDPTQGPACAIAAGAATIFRNYFVPIDGETGQTSTRQLDGLEDLGVRLAALTGREVDQLWLMRNGYALGTRRGVEEIGEALMACSAEALDALRAALRIGVHWNAEVTDAGVHPGPLVSQAFCSALPVAYSDVSRPVWAPFARLVLEAAYEATLFAGLVNRARGGSETVMLTALGGGVFGNDPAWIEAAMRRALELFRHAPLEVRLVSHRAPSPGFVALADQFG
jgi:hypothetical protein